MLEIDNGMIYRELLAGASLDTNKESILDKTRKSKDEIEKDIELLKKLRPGEKISFTEKERNNRLYVDAEEEKRMQDLYNKYRSSHVGIGLMIASGGEGTKQLREYIEKDPKMKEAAQKEYLTFDSKAALELDRSTIERDIDYIKGKMEVYKDWRLDLSAFYTTLLSKAEMLRDNPEQLKLMRVYATFAKDLELYKGEPDKMIKAIENLGTVLIKNDRVSKKMEKLLSQEGVVAAFIKNSTDDPELIKKVSAFKSTKSSAKKEMVTALIKDPKLFNAVSASLDAAIDNKEYPKNTRSYAKKFNEINPILSPVLKEYVNNPDASKALGHLLIDKSKDPANLDTMALKVLKEEQGFAKNFVKAYLADSTIIDRLPQNNRFGRLEKREYIVNMAKDPVIHKEIFEAIQNKMGAKDIKINTDFCEKFSQVYNRFHPLLAPYRGDPQKLKDIAGVLADLAIKPNNKQLSLDEKALTALIAHGRTFADNAVLNPNVSQAASENLKSAMKGMSINEYLGMHNTLTTRVNDVYKEEASKNNQNTQNLYEKAAVKIMVDLSMKPTFFSKKFDAKILSEINYDKEFIINAMKHPDLVKTISDTLDSKVKLPIGDKLNAINAVMSGLSDDVKLDKAKHANKVAEIVEASTTKGGLFRSAKLKEDMLEYHAKKACNNKSVVEAEKIVGTISNIVPSKKDIFIKNMAEVIEHAATTKGGNVSISAYNLNFIFGNYEIKKHATSLLNGSEITKEYLVNISVNPTLADALNSKESINDENKMKTFNANFKTIQELIEQQDLSFKHNQAVSKQVVKELTKPPAILKDNEVIKDLDKASIKIIVEECAKKQHNDEHPRANKIEQNRVVNQQIQI